MCTYIAAKKVTVAEFLQSECKKERSQSKDQGQQCRVWPRNVIIRL